LLHWHYIEIDVYIVLYHLLLTFVIIILSQDKLLNHLKSLKDTLILSYKRQTALTARKTRLKPLKYN